MLLLILVHTMLLDSNSLNSILPRMERSSQRQNQFITQEVLRKYAKEIKQAKLEEFRSFLDFTAMTFRDKRRHKIDNYVTADGCLPSRLIRMDSSRSSRLDGYVEAFKMLKSMTYRLTVLLLPGMVFVWHLSMQPRCTGIYSI